MGKWTLETSGNHYRIWKGTEEDPRFVAEFDEIEDARLVVSCINGVKEEIKQLQHDNEILYRANCEISETADRLREALEASTDLLVRVEKAFTEAWCIDWNELPIQAEKNRAALEQEGK